MTKEKQKELDRIVQCTIVKQYVDCFHRKDIKKHNELQEKARKAGFFWGVSQQIAHECREVVTIVSGMDDWSEYLSTLDDNTWEAQYSTGFFWYLEKEIKERYFLLMKRRNYKC